MIQIKDEAMLQKTLTPVISENISDDFKAIKNEDGEILSVMTSKYHLVPNNQVWNAINDGLYKYHATLEKVSMFKNKRTHWDISLGDEFNADVKVGDTIKSGIRVYNSYDGSKKLTASLWLLRLACLNGMTVSDITKEFDAQHLIGNINMRIFTNKIEEIANSSSKFITNKLSKLSDIPMTEDKVLAFLDMFPQKLHENLLIEISKGSNMWDLLNAGTYVMTHLADNSIEANSMIDRKLVSKVMELAN